MARWMLASATCVRIAIHPGDIGWPTLVDSIDATIARFARSHVASQYGSLNSH